MFVLEMPEVMACDALYIVLKGKVHPNMKFLSSFTQPRFVNGSDATQLML